MTQSESEPLPSLPNTITRNGVYYLRVRHDGRLASAGITPSHFTKSLRTRDRKEASRKAAEELARHKRREADRLAELDSGRLKPVSKPVPRDLRPLAELPEEEKRNLVFAHFAELEERARESRLVGSTDGRIDKAPLLLNAREDLAHYQQMELTSEGGAPYSWFEEVSAFLRDQGISFDNKKPDYPFLDLFRRAILENEWRTVAHLEGTHPLWKDRPFRDIEGMQSGGLAPPTRIGSGQTIADLLEAYPKRKGEGKGKLSTQKNEKRPLEILRHFFGDRMPLASISYDDGEEMIHYLGRLPSKIDQLPLRVEAASTTPLPDDVSVISPKRQLDLFRVMKGTFSYAAARGWISENPWKATTLTQLLPKVGKTPTVVWTGDDLTKIFTAPQFTRRYGERRGGHKVYARFWLPLIVAFTGARPNEIASLTIGDIAEKDGILFFKIREEDESGKVTKSLKTKASVRDIPVHEELLNIGLGEFLARLDRSDPCRQIFPELTPDTKTGSYSKNTSKTFITLARKLSGRSLPPGGRGLDMKSFRHIAADCLREAISDPELRDRVLGHSKTAGRNAGQFYGSGHSLSTVQNAVNTIHFPGFDPSPLYGLGDSDECA